jgi:iron transport multicopper oxidase
MVDGLRGPLIVHDPNDPYAGKYDGELVLTFSDWYHDQMPSVLSYYLSPEQNPSGAEPELFSAVFNEMQSASLSVQPGKTYLVRIISMAAFAQAYIWFDQHDLTIVEVDGVYTRPQPVSSIYIATAQRYSALLKTKAIATTNYAITASMDDNDFDSVPDYLVQNVTASLTYNKNAPFLSPVSPINPVVFNDFNLVPYDGQRWQT